MCGIYGVIGESVEADLFDKAGKAMRHRGPDHDGRFQSGIINLGHQRLSIIDLSANGNQPIFNEDRSVAIVFNGEIYNYKSLRLELERKHQFSSNSDTEVIVHAYEEWGFATLLKKIEGMFAFAIWDKKKNLTHFARDRFGKKPLYYHLKAGVLRFSSDISSLTKLLPNKLQLCEKAVHQYLIYGFIPAPLSVYEGIYKLPQAHCMTFDINSGTLSSARYWEANYNIKSNSDYKTTLNQVEQSLEQAVEKRLVADVPIGAFLSGGIDSSLVAATVRKHFGRPLKTFTIGFDDERFNEAQTAQAVAKSLSTEHYEVNFNELGSDELEEIFGYFGEPFADASCLPTYLVSKFSKQEVKVVLTGDGGDEGFAGYYTALACHYAQKSKIFFGNPIVRNILKRTPLANDRRFKWLLALNQKSNGNFICDPHGRKNLRNEFHWLVRGNQLTKSLESADSIFSDEWNESSYQNWVDRCLAVELESQLPSGLLTKTDVSTMANSIEARCPFLDSQLMDLSFRIPAEHKLRGGKTKAILRDLLGRHLPAKIIDLPKKGFGIPIDQWTRTHEREIMARLEGSSTILNRYLHIDRVKEMFQTHFLGHCDLGNQVWLIYILAAWIDRNANSID